MLTPHLRKVVAALATAGLAVAGLLAVPGPASATPDTYVASYVSPIDGPIALAPSGSVLAAANGATLRLVWTSSEADATAPVTLTSPAVALQFSSDGARLVVAETTGVQVFTVAVTTSGTPTASLTLVTGTPASQLAAPAATAGNAVLGLAVLNVGSAIVLQKDSLGHGLLVVYSFPSSGTPAAPVVVQRPDYYTAIALSRDGGTLYASTASSIAVNSVASLTAAGSSIPINNANTPESLAVSPDGTTLVVGGSTALVRISTSNNQILGNTLTYPESDQGYPVDPVSGTVSWNPTPPSEPTACDSITFSSDSKTVYCTGPNLYWFAASPSLDYRGALQLSSAAAAHLGGLVAASTGRVYVSLATQLESVPTALLTQASLPVGSTPGPPSNVTATAATDSITVSWTAPTNTGGLALTGYSVTADPDCAAVTVPRGVCTGSGDVDTDTNPTNNTTDDATCSPGGSGTSCTITSLQPWVPYGLTVVAKNAKGTGSVASATAEVTPGIPGAPSGVSANLQGDGSVVVSWLPSTFNGAAPLLGYRVTAVDAVRGGAALSCLATATAVTAPDATSCTFNAIPAVSGAGVLHSGVTYKFSVVAVNNGDHGDSVPVAAASTLTYGAPSAPTSAAVVPADTSMVVTWAPPTYIGGTIKNYVITLTPGGIHCGTTLGVDARTCTITGLTNGTHYSVSLVAVNSVGNGSPAVFPDVVPATVPSGPAITGVTPKANELDVTWNAPSTDGGQTISKYTVYARVSQSSTPKTCTTNGTTFGCNLTGLVNGTTYTVTVVATNAMGDGTPSQSTTAVPNGPPGAPVGVAATVKGDVVTVKWTGSTNTTITGYEVESDSGQGCDVTGNGTTCKITNVPTGTHTITVWAVADSITSDGSDPVTVTVLPRVSAPVIVKKKLDKKHHTLTVTFKWTAPAGFAVSGYRVERANGVKWFVKKPTTTYKFTTGGYRAIRVVALNGDGESQPSDWRRFLSR